jgi:aminoglycoside/choline kinase family phosphotransferase
LNIQLLLHRFFDRSDLSFSVVTLKGDASSRKYHRVLLNPKEADGFSSLIVMELPDDALKSDEASLGENPSELPFVDVARHLAEKEIRVPKLLLDATADGALLLEDLGDRQLVDVVTSTSDASVRDWYEAAVELLADMHEKMTPIPRTSIASKRVFGEELLRWELDHYREWGIEAYHGAVLRPDIRRDLDTAFDVLAAEIAALPKGFVHRDYQSRNLMVLAEMPDPASLAVIDFQDAFLGPRVYDLVALLNDSYVDLTWDLKLHIISRYAKLRGIDEAELLAEFHLVTVQRKLKDGGRFVFIDRVKKNPSFLPFVEKSFERVSASVKALPGREALKSALCVADPMRFQSLQFESHRLESR